ncbi:unnamed protein product [Rotaria magnacalcarata]|uniref:Uncharacterized protein n=1 Tax=Rotaria magnacalcarata TaxID=392030 RepID=A0A819JRK7_9BILA|nr:unnamed protein product [Rotaria magnacalcarata]CAF3934776.1 unnamed protein product [Rotaria magnacalcarata]
MTKNHAQFSAVWFGSKCADWDQTSRDRRAQLSPIINYNVKFSDADECLDYIKTIQTESVVFIICDSQEQKTDANYLSFSTVVVYLYIYCFNKVKHEEWTLNKNYASKICGVFTDIDLILAKITDDAKLSLKKHFTIEYFSQDEYEMLFCVGTVFRIESVEDNGTIWHVVLELCNDENIELKGFVGHFSKYVVETKRTLLALADVLTEMGEYEKVRHFSELFLSDVEPFPQNQLAGVIQSNIDHLDNHEGHYEKAMQKYETGVSMQLFQQTVELLSDEHDG